MEVSLWKPRVYPLKWSLFDATIERMNGPIYN